MSFGKFIEPEREEKVFLPWELWVMELHWGEDPTCWDTSIQTHKDYNRWEVFTD